MDSLFYEITDEMFADVLKTLEVDAETKKKHSSIPREVPKGRDEIVMLYKMGFKYHHKNIDERFDGKFRFGSPFLAECKSTNTLANELKFKYRAKESFIKVCENHRFWQLCGVWDPVENRLLFVLCGTIEQIADKLLKSNKTKNKDLNISLPALIERGFKVICMDDISSDYVYNFIVSKYPSISKKCIDIIEYDDFNKDIFYHYDKHNEKLNLFK